MNWLTDLFSGGVQSTVKAVADSVAQFVDTPEKKQQFELAKAQAAIEVQKLQIQAEQAYLGDRQSARAMYDKSNWIQQVYAMVFLIGYLAITVAMIWFIISWIGQQKIAIPDWAVALISTIYGGMSAKVSTITDFFFGSSQGSRDKDTQVQSAMSKVPTAG